MHIPPRVGLERLVQLGESAECLALVSAITFSLALDCLLGMADADVLEAVDTAEQVNMRTRYLTLFYGKFLCFLLALAFSAFATVFGMLQGNYARLSKCKDMALCEELDLPEATRMRLRIALAAEMDSFFFRPLPAGLPSHKRAPPAHHTHLCL